MSDIPASPRRKPGFLARLFGWFGAVMFWLRQTVINLIVLVVVVLVVGALFSGETRPTVPSGAALVVHPYGSIVEESEPFDPFSALMSGRQNRPSETLLRDLTDVLRAAAEDSRIEALVLDLSDMGYAAPAALEELGAALVRFKDSGKTVIAAADYFSQQQYYLASFANEVYMNPMGQLLLNGYGMFGTYYQGLLEKLGVNVHVFRVGTYKAAVEPFMRTDMSQEAKQANRELLEVLWADTRDTIALNRGLSPDAVQAYADQFPELLAQSGNDMARVALEQGLVDDVLTRDRMRARLRDLVGPDESGQGFLNIEHRQYLPHARAQLAANHASDEGEIAVVVARGAISMGERPRDEVGADSLSELIREVRQNERYKGLVLRVDSPGGSSFASELIRQELELTRLAGKPVVVSMGGMAASGGYWISASADEIWAAPTTITGSIGIFSIVPTFEASMERIGVSGDGVGVTELAGGIDPVRGLSKAMADILQRTVESGYRQFLELVASGRDMSVEQVDAVGQGRVWAGADALKHGLVDQLGYLDDAVASAAQMAKLDSWHATYVRKPESPRELLLRQFMQTAGIEPLPFANAGLRTMLDDASRWLDVFNDPQYSYALCMACQLPVR